MKDLEYEMAAAYVGGMYTLLVLVGGLLSVMVRKYLWVEN